MFPVEALHMLDGQIQRTFHSQHSVTWSQSEALQQQCARQCKYNRKAKQVPVERAQVGSTAVMSRWLCSSSSLAPLPRSSGACPPSQITAKAAVPGISPRLRAEKRERASGSPEGTERRAGTGAALWEEEPPWR